MSEPDPLSQRDPAALGVYSLIGRLGKGGQGVVYLGQDAQGDQYAIKVLNEQWSQDSELRRRFEKEVRAAQKVDAFCTAAIHEADLEQEQPYVVSEFVPGASLQESVAAEGPRRGASLQRLAISTATALVAIHQAGIVHRDFKPGNVLLGPDGPRVIDFGIARVVDGSATMTGSVMGTPSYMAPEQIEGEAVTDKVDIFAWGCVIAFASTGDAPFGTDSVPAVVHRVVTATPDLHGVPESLRTTVAACLHKDPQRRPTARELLMRLLGHEVASSAPPSADEAMAEGERASQRVSRTAHPGVGQQAHAAAAPPHRPPGSPDPRQPPGSPDPRQALGAPSGPQPPAQPPASPSGPQTSQPPYPPPGAPSPTQGPMPPTGGHPQQPPVTTGNPPYGPMGMPQQPMPAQPPQQRPHQQPQQRPRSRHSNDPVLAQGWILPAVFIAIIILLLLVILIAFAR